MFFYRDFNGKHRFAVFIFGSYLPFVGLGHRLSDRKSESVMRVRILSCPVGAVKTVEKMCKLILVNHLCAVCNFKDSKMTFAFERKGYFVVRAVRYGVVKKNGYKLL